MSLNNSKIMLYRKLFNKGGETFLGVFITVQYVTIEKKSQIRKIDAVNIEHNKINLIDAEKLCSCRCC